MTTRHSAVLLQEVVHWLKPESEASARYCLYFDGTLGGGGHAEALLQASSRIFLVGLDRDPNAVRRCEERLRSHKDRVFLACANFVKVRDVMDSLPGEVRTKLEGADKSSFPLFDRMLVDLGISSDQLDDSTRGFSYMEDAPLDMRMNQREPKTAASVLNEYSVRELERMFLRGGMLRALARALARAVVSRRPLERTFQFSEICRELSPEWLRKRKGLSPQHPATIPFQALRIEVNEEFRSIEIFLGEAIQCLAPGGRLAVISFHSGEDKLVTNQMRQWSRSAPLPRNVAAEPPPPAGKLLTRKAILPSLPEIERNARARSARLRVFEKNNHIAIGAVS